MITAPRKPQTLQRSIDIHRKLEASMLVVRLRNGIGEQFVLLCVNNHNHMNIKRKRAFGSGGEKSEVIHGSHRNKLG
jgi:hypothetical protein